MKKAFIQWLIVFVSTILLGAFLNEKLLFDFILSNDKSYMGGIILILFAFCSVFTGALAFACDSVSSFTSSAFTILRKKLSINQFISDHFFSLGLFGTLVGILMILFEIVSKGGVESQELINGLVSGLSTALISTAVGIACHALLEVQLFIVQYHLEDE